MSLYMWPEYPELQKEEAKGAAAANTNIFQRFIKTLGDIFVPIIPAICCFRIFDGNHECIGLHGG